MRQVKTCPTTLCGWEVMDDVFRPGDVFARPGNIFARPENAVARPGNAFARPENVVPRPENGFARPGDVVSRPENLFARSGNVVARSGNVFARPGNVFARAGNLVARAVNEGKNPVLTIDNRGGRTDACYRACTLRPARRARYCVPSDGGSARNSGPMEEGYKTCRRPISVRRAAAW